jgi:hypothetical protein
MGVVASGKGQLLLGIESNWEVGGGFPNQMEYYWSYRAPGQSPNRFISYNGQLSTPFRTELGLRAGTVTVGGALNLNSPALLTVQPTNAYLTSDDAAYGLYVDRDQFKLFSGAGLSAAMYVRAASFETNVPILPNGADLHAVGSTAFPFQSAFFTRGIQVGSSMGARPTANASSQGRIFVAQGASGVADVVYVCIKAADETYSWKTFTVT